MALYIPHSIFHLVRLLYVRPETFGPYYVCMYVCMYVCVLMLINPYPANVENMMSSYQC